jgi:hypothetical protein
MWRGRYDIVGCAHENGEGVMMEAEDRPMCTAAAAAASIRLSTFVTSPCPALPGEEGGRRGWAFMLGFQGHLIIWVLIICFLSLGY